MNFQRVFEIINEMQAAGIVERYAIGGAVGATFYLEPVSTLDVDVFIAFSSSGLLVDPSPVFDWLKAKGGVMEGEYIVIEGTPVQILMAGTPLVEEALREAIARVFTAEHLAAIALEVGRAKDKARVLQFIEEGALDAPRFEAIIARHGLQGRWETFQRQFLE
jgi:hypothetical protein